MSYLYDAEIEDNGPDDKTLEAGLLAAFYRHECPDSMELGDYQLGLLAEAEREEIEAHLTRCPHCQAELQRLTEFLAESDTAAETVRETGQEPDWITASGYMWKKILDTGEVVIRLLSGALPTAGPQLVPIAVRGTSSRPDDSDVLRRISLSPDEIEDLDLEAVVRQSSEPHLCSLLVRVEIPSRWPELSGMNLTVTAGTWQAEGITNDEGQALFAEIPIELKDQLEIGVFPPATET